MGQYFIAVCLDEMEAVIPSDYGETAKLTETSWVGNDYVGAVEKLLSPHCDWHGCRIVWAGDYMDAGQFMDEFEHSLAKSDDGKPIHTLYDFAKKFFAHVKSVSRSRPGTGFLVNLDKKLFVRMDGCPKDSSGSQLNPLPLLTCVGNGQGGGDYYGKAGAEFVGAWCGDHLAIETKSPDGYEEIRPGFLDE